MYLACPGARWVTRSLPLHSRGAVAKWCGGLRGACLCRGFSISCFSCLSCCLLCVVLSLTWACTRACMRMFGAIVHVLGMPRSRLGDERLAVTHLWCGYRVVWWFELLLCRGFSISYFSCCSCCLQNMAMSLTYALGLAVHPSVLAASLCCGFEVALLPLLRIRLRPS